MTTYVYNEVIQNALGAYIKKTNRIVETWSSHAPSNNILVAPKAVLLLR